MKATKKLLALVLAVVMIMAMAVTASAATVEIENAQEGKVYKFYKLFDYVPETEWYKVTAEWDSVLRWNKDAGTGYFELDGNGYILSKATGLSNTVLAAELKDNIPSTATPTTVTAGASSTTVDLPLGYYLMVSELGGTESLASLAMITKEGLEIREKNTPDGLPKIEKTYADGSTSGSYSIGDTVEFKVVITVEEGATKYTVHDKAQDLTVDYASVTYEVSTSTAATVTGTVVTDSICTDCTFHIELEVSEALKAYDTITIKYKATVTGDNPKNQAWLDAAPGTDDPGTNSYNYGFAVNKTDGTNTLEGAKFILSRVKDGATQYGKFNTTTGKLEGWTTEGEATVLTAGTFNVSGLAAGSYMLTETVAPIGYKKLASDINITIAPDADDESKPDVTASGAGVTVSGSKDTGFTVNVKNNPIDPLPETGGMGTTMFYVIGGLMVAAALVLLTSKKRMAA